MGKLRPFVRKDSYMPNKKWIPFVIGNGYTTTDGASGPAPEYETVTGNPVSFNAITPFPLKQLQIAFSPVQDLHGYDAPWPAGGGKNKFDKSTAVYGFYISDGSGAEISGSGAICTDFIPVVGGAEYYIMTAASSGNWGAWYDDEKQFVSGITGGGVKTAPQNAKYIRFTVKNNEASANSVDTFAINYPSSVTIYSPYSNICPISGWDGVTVEQRGKNLADYPNMISAGAVEQEDGSLYVENARTYSGTKIFQNSGISGRMAITFIVKNNSASRGIYPTIVYTDGTSQNVPVNFGYDTFTTFTTTTLAGKDVDYIGFNYGIAAVKTWFYIQVEIGETASPYQPYNPSSRSISISFGSTVYSGTLDVLTGVCTVDKKCVTLVGGESETWGNYSANYGGYRLIISDANVNGKPSKQLLSNQFVGHTVRGIMQNWSSGKILTYNSPLDNTQVFFTTDITVKQDWLDWLAANPTQLVYPLAEPITIQLTPQEVQSLLGVNNMWSNANQPITVEYRKN